MKEEELQVGRIEEEKGSKNGQPFSLLSFFSEEEKIFQNINPPPGGPSKINK